MIPWLSWDKRVALLSFIEHTQGQVWIVVRNCERDKMECSVNSPHGKLHGYGDYTARRWNETNFGVNLGEGLLFFCFHLISLLQLFFPSLPRLAQFVVKWTENVICSRSRLVRSRCMCCTASECRNVLVHCCSKKLILWNWENVGKPKWLSWMDFCDFFASRVHHVCVIFFFFFFFLVRTSHWRDATSSFSFHWL